MLDTAIDQLESLRRTNRDLATCLALPAMWAGREPRYVVTTLLDMLVSMLGVDAAYAVIHDSAAGVTLEEWRPRAPAPPLSTDTMAADGDHGNDAGSCVHVPGVGNVRLARARLSVRGARGMVVAAATRADFP